MHIDILYSGNMSSRESIDSTDVASFATPKPIGNKR